MVSSEPIAAKHRVRLRLPTAPDLKNPSRSFRRCGADHSLRAAKGQTIHHISVENDKVLPLIYFRDLVDPNVKNDLGETPLIYACEIK